MNISRIYRTGIQAQVTFNGYIISACSGNIALAIANNVHVNSAVFCFDCCIAHGLAFFYNNAAALDIYYCAASVCPDTVCIALEVYITVNSNAAALAVLHAAGCIQAGCSIVLIAAVIAVDVQLYITIDNYITSVINTNGIVIALCGDIHVAVYSQFGIAISNSHALQAIRAYLSTSEVHFYGICFDRQSIGIVNFNTCSRYTGYVLNIQG